MKSNSQTFETDLVEIIREITGWNEVNIRKQLLEERSFHSLKVDQLKKICKSLHRKGWKVNTAGNKADLIQGISIFLQSNLISKPETSVSGPIVQPPRVPVSLKNPVLTLTTQEKSIVEDLFQLEGLTKDEILEALFEVPPSDRNTDSVLLSILNKRQQTSSASSLNLPSTKEQEDSELDRAILESEKERDNIQDRKRRRISGIIQDCSISISSTEEFFRSVLLRGLAFLPDSAPDFVHGSKNLRQLSEILDTFFARKLVPPKDTTVIDLVSEPLQLDERLRQSVVELLLTEATVLKFYGEASYPFLVYETELIDRTLESLLSSLGTDYDTQLQNIQLHENFIIDFLTLEKSKIEIGIAKLVKDGEAIPTILRKRFLLPYYNAVQHCVDKDGFEVVNNTANIKFVDDISESESDDDDENYDTD